MFDYEKRLVVFVLIVGKNLIVGCFVRKTNALETALAARCATRTVDLQNFVLSKTYRKKVTDDLTLRVRTVKSHVPHGCGLTRINRKTKLLSRTTDSNK